MSSDPIADAVARATPNVAELLDRHAKWSAAMCRNVPSPDGEKFPNVPSAPARGVAQTAEMFLNLPESSGMFHQRKNDETNPVPPEPPRPLTYRQLAAARLMIKGRGTLEIAHHLGVEHHSVARWKRNPLFREELDRLRARFTESALAAAAARPSAPPPRVASQPIPRPPEPAALPMTRAQIAQEDRACEAMIEQLLRAHSARKGR